MSDIDSVLERLDRVAGLLEQQIHGGGSGLGSSNVRGDRGLDVRQLEMLIKNVKLNGQQFGLFNKVLKANQTIASQVKDSLNELDDEIEKVTNAAEGFSDELEREEKRQELIGKRKELAAAADLATVKQANERLMESFGRSGTIFAAGVGKVITGLTGGSSAFELSSGIMSAGLDIVGETSKAAGNAVGATGTIMSNSTNPKLKMLGNVAAVAGPLIGALGDQASKAAKFGIEVLTKEVEKNIKSFHTATAAGAMYADGMTGLNRASSDAGLTVDKFAEVLSKHSGDLSASGLGVAEGAKLMGRVSKEIRASGVGTQLQKLGFGFEEQAGLVAETTANMRRSSGGKSTDQEIAQQTAKYAESLRTIAAITGEDAKKKTEEAKAQNQILAFQQEMAKKTPEQRAAIDAAMSTMTEQEKKNFRDRAVFGTVINKEGAIYESTLAGARQKGEAQFALLQQNNMTAEENSKLNAQYGDQLRESALSQQAFGAAGMAAGGVVGDVAKSMLDTINQSNAYTKDAVAATAEAINGQKNATDKLTEGVVKAESALNQFQIDVQKLMIAPMGEYAKFTGEMLDSMRAMVEKATGEVLNKDKGESLWDKTKRYGSKAIDRGVTGATMGAMYGTIGGTVVPGAGNVVGGVSGTLVGGVVGAIEGLGEELYSDLFNDKNVAKKAEGGLTEPGKLNIAGEAGMEAVVPLPDGGSIPVKLNINDLMNNASVGEDGKMSKDLSFLAAMQAEAMGNTMAITKSNSDVMAMLTKEIPKAHQQANHRGPAHVKKSESVFDGIGKFLSSTNPLFKAVDSIATMGENIMADPRSLGEQASAGFDSMSTGMTDMMDWATNLPQKLAQTAADIVIPQQEAAPAFDPTELINQITRQNADSLSSMTTTLTELINTAKDQLEKQDEMLRAMNDTKDATERLYGAMA